MAVAKITASMVEKPAKHTVEVKPGERRPLVPASGSMVVWDSSAGMTGFGVRVAPTGRVSYLCRYWTGERERWTTLGQHPRLSLGKAKAKARELLRVAGDGRDPVEEEREAKAAAKAAEAQTLASLAAEWFDYLPRHVNPKRGLISPSTVAWYETMMRTHVLPRIGGRPVADITRREVAALHQQVTKARGPASANGALAALGAFFGWCETIEAVAVGFNPTKKVPKNPEVKRGEHAAVRLRREQEGQLVAAIYDRMETDPIGATALLVLLDSCRRLQEVLGMRWARLDFETGLYDLGKSKGKKAGDGFWLTPRSRDAIRQLPRIVGVPWIFTGRGKQGRRVGLDSAWESVKRAAGIQELSPELRGFKVHDLRHHRVSEMSAAGVSDALIAQQVGWTSTAMMKTYSHLKGADVIAPLSRLEPVAPAPLGEVVAMGAGR